MLYNVNVGGEKWNKREEMEWGGGSLGVFVI